MKTEDNELISELFNLYHDILINYCKRKNCQERDSEEFVDEAFFRLTKNISRIEELHPKEQRSWLYSPVDNVILEHKYKNRYMTKEGMDTLENYITSIDNYDKIIDKITYSKIVNEVYEKLTDEDLSFLSDYLQDRISYSDIMSGSVRNYNTVKSKVYRKLLHIRNITEEVLREYGLEVSQFTKNKKQNLKK